MLSVKSLYLLRKNQLGFFEELFDLKVPSDAFYEAKTFEKSLIPSMIDEIPMFAFAAPFAKKATIVKDAKELRFKESDRISACVKGLKNLGAEVTEYEDGMKIEGKGTLKGGGVVESFHDHRIAMAAAIAATACEEPVIIKDADCTAISFPSFFDELKEFGIGVEHVK